MSLKITRTTASWIYNFFNLRLVTPSCFAGTLMFNKKNDMAQNVISEESPRCRTWLYNVHDQQTWWILNPPFYQPYTKHHTVTIKTYSKKNPNSQTPYTAANKLLLLTLNNENYIKLWSTLDSIDFTIQEPLSLD